MEKTKQKIQCNFGLTSTFAVIIFSAECNFVRAVKAVSQLLTCNCHTEMAKNMFLLLKKESQHHIILKPEHTDKFIFNCTVSRSVSV